jgi:predicted phage terminase large subunit-like protein
MDTTQVLTSLESQSPHIWNPVRLTLAQRRFRFSNALYRGFVGGRGSGKTFAGAWDMLCRAEEKRTYLIGSPTGVLMKDITFPAFTQLAKEKGFWHSVRLSPYPNITLNNGAVIRFRSAEQPERLRGPNLSGIWLDEASLMHEDAYLIAIACLREGGKQGWLSATFTPQGLTHWTYSVFGRNKPDTEIVISKTIDNPYNPSGFQQTLAQQYTGLRAAQELEGKFVSVEGAEWPAEFFADSMWFDDWNQSIPWRIRVMALDPSRGKADKSGDYSAWCMLGVDDQLCLWADADLDNSRPVDPSDSDPYLPSIIGDGLKIICKWRPQAIVVEINGFQELVACNLARAMRHAGLMRVPIYTINNTEPKETRIRSLGPYLAQKRLRIRKTPGGQLLQAQLRDFPMGEYKDGPDALKMAEVLADFLLSGNADGQGRPEILRV